MDARSHYWYVSNMNPARPNSIRTYNLFGEDSEFPDVAHSETIEARSTLHDWEFAPHRHERLHQIVLVQEGGGQARIEGTSHPLAPMSAVNLPMGSVHGFSFQTGTRGFVVTLSCEMMDHCLRAEEGLQRYLSTGVIFDAGADLTATLARFHSVFSSRDFARAQVLRSLAGLLLGQTALAIHRANPLEETPQSGVVSRFQTLVDLHFCDHWTVARYARELAVSATHLSRLTRAATGRPASALIQDRLIREARRNLVYTNLPVSRIAYALGYEDPAYFSRVFFRNTGRSPRAFRAHASGNRPATG